MRANPLILLGFQARLLHRCTIKKGPGWLLWVLPGIPGNTGGKGVNEPQLQLAKGVRT